jgi:hypothetical protein
MNREFVRAFGSIYQYNFKMAMMNFIGTKFTLSCDTNKLNHDANELNYGVADCDPDMDEIRSLVKLSKKILADARGLQIAAHDIETTANGQFPYELDTVKLVHGEDPRDWFFDVVNIENCNKCPLHADMAKPNKHIHACGAKECIVRQFCAMVGHKV